MNNPNKKLTKIFTSHRTGGLGSMQNTRQQDLNHKAQATIRQKKLKVSLAPMPWDNKDSKNET